MMRVQHGLLLCFALGLIFGSGVLSGQPQLVQAASITAVQNGVWSSPTTWGGTVPTATDEVTIPAGITVTSEVADIIVRQQNTTINGIWIGDGSISNSGTITINGRFELYSGALTNTGTITTSATGIIDWSTTFTNYSGGILTNNGTAEFFSTTTNTAGATFTNNYIVGIYATFTNNGTINTTVNLSIQSVGTLMNNGTIENYLLINNAGVLNNSGTINNHCGASVTGNAVTGNPPNNLCPTNTPTITPCVMSATSPNLVSPAHRAHTTDTTPTFNWSSIAGSQSYRVMVYLEDRSFEYKKRVFINNYTLQAGEALTQGTKYLWRVRTQDTTCSTWSTWSGRNTLFVD